jgi:hypothetical protein
MTNTPAPRGMLDHLAHQLERDVALMRVLWPLIVNPFVHRDQLAAHALPEAMELAFERVLVIRDIGGWYSATTAGYGVALVWLTQVLPLRGLPRFAALWSAVVDGSVSTDRAWPREDAG